MTTTAKHTPGPWTAEELFNPKEHRTTGRVFSNERHVADVRTQQSNAETDANAKLIAAAPDLLAVCVKLLAAYDDARAQCHGEILLAEARAAIARGTTPHD